MSKTVRLKNWLTNTRAWIALAGGDSYLDTSGWFGTKAQQRPIDANGQPIPWITYASLAFLEPRVRADMAVFEFGSGSSTLWWAHRVKRVVACEHDAQWYERVRSSAPSNVEITHAQLENQEYAREVLKYNAAFDVVVIDGRDRVRCAQNCLAALRSDGVILWDNSERTEYQPGYEFLSQHGFRRIDFSGMGPINVYGWSTSVFYRTDNCLGL